MYFMYQLLSIMKWVLPSLAFLGCLYLVAPRELKELLKMYFTA